MRGSPAKSITSISKPTRSVLELRRKALRYYTKDGYKQINTYLRDEDLTKLSKPSQILRYI